MILEKGFLPSLGILLACYSLGNFPMWWTVLQGMIVGLLLFASSAPLQSGYCPPQSSSLLGEISTFVADFGSWNAKNDDVPFRIWENTPEANKGETLVWLFWAWLHAEPLPSAFPISPPSWNNPFDTVIGCIALGQFGENPPTCPPDGGKDPPGLGDNDGNTWPPKDPPPPTSNDPPPQSNGSSGDPPGVPSVDPVPEPAALTLLAVGGIELLMGCWIWRSCSAASRRKTVNVSAK